MGSVACCCILIFDIFISLFCRACGPNFHWPLDPGSKCLSVGCVLPCAAAHYRAEKTKSCVDQSLSVHRRLRILTLFVAAMAMLSSNGCQLMCRIFLLKSI